MLKSTLARLRQARASELENEAGAESGFTLIELMVVLLIIAILLAIAIPTFLGVSGSANDRSAQSNLTNALTELKALYQNGQTYNVATLPVATLTASAPEFSWVQSGACTSAGGNCISEYPVDVSSAADGFGVITAAWAKGTNTCWYAVDLEQAPATTTFTDTGGTAQFVAGTTNLGSPPPQNQKVGASALTSAGVYYSKHTVASGSNCNAQTPTTNASAWNWGLSYSAAPAN